MKKENKMTKKLLSEQYTSFNDTLAPVVSDTFTNAEDEDKAEKSISDKKILKKLF